MVKCPLCGSSFILYDPERGEYYCGKCGYVIEQEQVINKRVLKQAKRDIKNAKFEWVSYKDDNYNYTIAEIRRIAANLNLPSYVVKEAEYIFRKVYTSNFHRRKNISAEALAPAVILIASEKYNQAVDFSILCIYAKEQPDIIRNAYLKLITIIQSKTLLHNTIEGEQELTCSSVKESFR